MSKRFFAFLSIGCLAFVVTLSAENWPAWRGPLANGVSGEKGLPDQVVDVRRTSRGSSRCRAAAARPRSSGAITSSSTSRPQCRPAISSCGPSIARRASRSGSGPLGGGNMKLQKQNMSTPSPVTDGTTVWVMTGTGILKAFDFKGTELWTRDVQKDYGPFGLNHGYASSPLLHQGSLYIQVLHGMKTDDPSYVMKVDGKTGKTLWKVDRPTHAISESPDSYTTPLLVGSGASAAIVITGGDIVTGHDLATGKEIWRANGLNPTNDPWYRIVASPVLAGGLIIAPTRNRPMLALRPGGTGDVTTSHKAWSFDFGPDVPTPISDGKLLYVVRDNGVVHALDVKTGAVVWGPERLKTGAYSCLARAGRRQVVRHQRERGVDDRVRGRSEAGSARRERARRLLPVVARRLERADLHPHRQVPLGDRQGEHQHRQLTADAPQAAISATSRSVDMRGRVSGAASFREAASVSSTCAYRDWPVLGAGLSASHRVGVLGVLRFRSPGDHRPDPRSWTRGLRGPVRSLPRRRRQRRRDGTAHRAAASRRSTMSSWRRRSATAFPPRACPRTSSRIPSWPRS